MLRKIVVQVHSQVWFVSCEDSTRVTLQSVLRVFLLGGGRRGGGPLLGGGAVFILNLQIWGE